MRRAPSLEFLQRELRSRICRRCYLRPPGSRWHALNAPRACEARCAIFTTLRRVHQIGLYHDPMVQPYEEALRRFYRDVCSHGEPSGSRRPPHTDQRALNTYQHRVIQVLVRILNGIA